MIQEEIRSLNEYLKYLKKFNDKYPICRGENDDYEYLTPKIGRFIIERNEMTSDGADVPAIDIETERESLSDFRRESISFVSNNINSQLEWLALAQHHGLPTRLLDWTKNPLVAAYFACNKNHNDYAVIYVIDEYIFDEIDPSISPFDINNILTFKPCHTARRIASQMGLFTIHPQPELHFSHDQMHRLIINKKNITKIDINLSCLGIHDAFIFPGLDGIASKVARDYGLLSI